VPYLNSFCAFGRLQGGASPRTFEHAQRESRGKCIPSVMYNIFHDGMAYWLWSLDGTADSPSMLSYAFVTVSG
jgi:hypothetical protein